MPASIISINGKEYIFNNINSFEGNRSPISAIYSHPTELFSADNLDTKFWLRFKVGIFPIGDKISLVGQPNEGLKEVQFQIFSGDTLYYECEESYIKGSYSNGIVKYDLENVRLAAYKIDYINMPVPTTDTVIINATIYAYSDR